MLPFTVLSVLISEHTPHLEFIVPLITAAERQLQSLTRNMRTAVDVMQTAGLQDEGSIHSSTSLFKQPISSCLIWAVAFLFIIWTLDQALKFWRYRSLVNLIPGPPADFWTGNSGDIKRAGGWIRYTPFIRALHKQYGPVVRFWRGRQLVVSINEPPHVRQVFAQATSNPHNGRKSAPFLPAESIFWGDLKEVKARRSWLAHHLNTSFLQKVYPISVASVLKVADSWSALEGEDIDLKPACSSLALEIIGSVAFGADIWALPICREFERLFVSTPRASARFASHSIEPWWDADYRALRRDCRRMKEIAAEILRSRESTVQDVSEEERKGGSLSSDFLGSLLSAQDKRTGQLIYTPEQAQAQVVGTMFAGNHTTGTSLMWILLRLAQIPEVQAKVSAEIALHCKSCPPSEDEISRLQYLPAVIHESLRLAPVNVTKSRVCNSRDLVVGGYLIPKGTSFAAPVESLNLDTAAWGPDTEVFRPERFLERHNHSQAATSPSSGRCPFSFVDPGSTPAFMTFGRGARACLGRAFSVAEQKAVIATLVQRFELSLTPSQGSAHFSNVMDNLLIQPHPSPLIRVKRRDHA